MKQILLFILWISIGAFAQDGNIDTAFNTLDTGKGDGFGSNSVISKAIIQDDGKMIVVGNFMRYNGVSLNRIVRLNIDGSIDTSFNSGTGPDIRVTEIAIQDDGKIIIAGFFFKYNGIASHNLARLNTDGTLDTSFNIGSSVNGLGAIADIVIQDDGKIIIVGTFTSYNGISSNKIARLNTDGTLDTSFNSGTGPNNGINKAAIQADGKVIIVGRFTSYNSVSLNRIARLNTDGTLDTSFNSGTGTDGNIDKTAIQNDGKVVIVGAFTSYNGISSNKIARLNTDGTLDTSFNSGSGISNSVFNKITFAIQDDGKVIIGGDFSSYNNISLNGIGRLNTDGTLDTSFNSGSGINNDVSTIVIQDDGKIIIGGSFRRYNGVSLNRIGRLYTNGSIDTSFNSGTGPNNVVSASAIQEGGKIIIGGYFTSYNGISSNKIARLNTDGTLDTSFNSGTGPNSAINSITIQDDGKMIIVGFFTSYNGISSNKIARLNTDGTLDTSFNSGSSVNGLGAIADIVIQDDGKIIIVGTFTSYNGISSNKIARLNTDGTLDTSFNSGGTGPNSGINKAAIQNDGKIIIVGDFTSYNGISSNKIIARLNTDGTLDTSFNSSTGVNGIVRTIAIQNDGKIIIVGDFTSYNGIIARLNTDGTLDTSFNSGTGVNGIVRTIAIQEDGNIILGGEFTSYNNIRKNRIIRVLSSSVLHISDNEIDNDNIKVFPNPVKDILNINLYKGLELNRINVYNTLGQLISSSKKEKIDTSSLKRGIYFVEVLTNQGKFTKKILVE